MHPFARLTAVFAIVACVTPSLAQPLEQLTLSEFESRAAEGDFGKIAVLAAEQNGEIVYRYRFDGQAEAAPVDIRSAGKSIAAMAIGAAIADGKLAGAQVAVWPYLGRERGAPFDAITVADLLGMSSALDCNDSDKRSPGQEEKMYRTREWRDFALSLPARPYHRDIRGEGTFSYCTAGVFLLGQVVEQATGERFDTYVQRRLFDPLGITGVEWKRSRSGEIQAGGQLAIDAGSLLKLGRLMLDRGRWNGEQVLPEDWIEAMLAPRHKLSENVVYGNLWWGTALRSPRGFESAWMMMGNGGNIVAILRDYNAVMVVQSRNYNREDADRYSFTAMSALLSSLEAPAHPIAE